jgi:hypothetical protein
MEFHASMHTLARVSRISIRKVRVNLEGFHTRPFVFDFGPRPFLFGSMAEV